MLSRSRLQEAVPKLVLAPSFALILIFVYGFILYTGYLSFTDSKICAACVKLSSDVCQSAVS